MRERRALRAPWIGAVLLLSLRRRIHAREEALMPKEFLTIDDIRLTVDAIETRAGERDYEAAHALEDRLYEGVLRSIARGAPDAEKLAIAALETRNLRFKRSCA